MITAQPAPTAPATRDQGPRAEASIQIPMPTWIQTAAAPAAMGWKDQDEPAQLTRSRTQPGAPAAAGAMTLAGSPAAIAGWACKIPSNTHSNPNPIRSSLRPDGSLSASRLTAAPAPAALSFGSHSLTVVQRTANVASISSATSPWCIRADRNASTRTELVTFSPLCMPGIGSGNPCWLLPPLVAVGRACGHPEYRRLGLR